MVRLYYNSPQRLRQMS